MTIEERCHILKLHRQINKSKALGPLWLPKKYDLQYVSSVKISNLSDLNFYWLQIATFRGCDYVV